MLEFSEKLTLIPSSITEVDIETLRGHGFSDRDILSIILAGAYRSYIVRVADALGIELNPTVDYAQIASYLEAIPTTWSHNR